VANGVTCVSRRYRACVHPACTHSVVVVVFVVVAVVMVVVSSSLFVVVVASSRTSDVVARRLVAPPPTLRHCRASNGCIRCPLLIATAWKLPSPSLENRRLNLHIRNRIVNLSCRVSLEFSSCVTLHCRLFIAAWVTKDFNVDCVDKYRSRPRYEIKRLSFHRIISRYDCLDKSNFSFCRNDVSDKAD